MNKQACEQYTEWMSLAQDGMLDRTQMHVLRTHIDTCPSCRNVWEAMTAVSRVFRAAPMVAPASGFVQRFEARLAYREELRRRAMIWLLLGIGVVALALLALPSILGALSLTGRLVLPYAVVTYLQGLFDWTYLVVSALLQAAWILIRYVCAGPAGPVCVALIAVAGAMIAMWTKFLMDRLARQRA
jgi:predicted anti-sigma-YlaC factor YlaD